MKARQNFFLFLGLLSIGIMTLVLFVVPVNTARAITETNASITNTATIEWSGQSATDEYVTGVKAMYGATWLGGADTSVSAGNNAVNTTTLSNCGNAPADYALTSAISAEDAAQAWSTYFSNTVTDDNGVTITISDLSVGGAISVTFVSVVHASETNGSTRTYQCTATCTDAVTANAVAYTGNNGTVYGGTIGIYGATVGTLRLSNTTQNDVDWTVSVNAAVMELTKTAVVLNPAPYTGGDPVPGALITYKLAYTNSGSAIAEDVKIVDVIPTTYLTYVANSLKSGAFGDTYAGAVGTPTDAEDDAGDEGSLTGTDTITFTPNGVAPTTPSDCAIDEAGAYFYRTTLN